MEIMSHVSELQGLKRYLKLHLGGTEVVCSGKHQCYGSLDCLSDWYKSFCMARGADTVTGKAAGGDECRCCIC